MFKLLSLSFLFLVFSQPLNSASSSRLDYTLESAATDNSHNAGMDETEEKNFLSMNGINFFLDDLETHFPVSHPYFYYVAIKQYQKILDFNKTKKHRLGLPHLITIWHIHHRKIKKISEENLFQMYYLMRFMADDKSKTFTEGFIQKVLDILYPTKAAWQEARKKEKAKERQGCIIS